MVTPNPFRSSANSGQFQALMRSPSAIAALASLGVHALIFTILPLLPHNDVKAKEAEIKDPVAITELTPAEQQRLPDMVTLPPVELPPVASVPRNGSLFTLPSLSQPNTRTSITPSYDSLLAPPPPLPIFIPPITPPTQFPSFSTIQIAPTQPAPVQPIQPKPANSPASSPAASPTAPSPSTSPSVAIEPPAASPAAPDNPPNQTSEGQVAVQPANPEASPARTETDIRRDLLARQQELRELYTYRPDGTKPESAQISFLSWYREAMGKDYAEGDSRPPTEELTADYPKLACPLKPERRDHVPRAVVGVVIDSDSKIVGDPKLLQSSGYALFNQEALQLAKSYAFKNDLGNNRVYLLAVNFKYSDEVCPAGLSPAAPAG